MTKRTRKSTTIYITKPDYERLNALSEKTQVLNGIDHEYVKN